MGPTDATDLLQISASGWNLGVYDTKVYREYGVNLRYDMDFDNIFSLLSSSSFDAGGL